MPESRGKEKIPSLIGEVELYFIIPFERVNLFYITVKEERTRVNPFLLYAPNLKGKRKKGKGSSVIEKKGRLEKKPEKRKKVHAPKATGGKGGEKQGVYQCKKRI